MKKKIKLLTIFVGVAAFSSIYALNTNNEREPVEFFSGHTHGEDGSSIGAPQHSGGTDKRGCHNRSVPYHCH